jgi:hypothetical protein
LNVVWLFFCQILKLHLQIIIKNKSNSFFLFKYWKEYYCIFHVDNQLNHIYNKIMCHIGILLSNILSNCLPKTCIWDTFYIFFPFPVEMLQKVGPIWSKLNLPCFTNKSYNHEIIRNKKDNRYACIGDNLTFKFTEDLVLTIKFGIQISNLEICKNECFML